MMNLQKTLGTRNVEGSRVPVDEQLILDIDYLQQMNLPMIAWQMPKGISGIASQEQQTQNHDN